MNPAKAFIFLLAVGFTGLKGISQQKSLLWRVNGNGLSHPSYIFGTVHIICSTDFVLKDKVVNAFNESHRLVVEVDMTDPKEMQAGQQLMNSGKKLTDSLSDSEEKILDSALKQHFKISLSQVDHVHPSLLESMMAKSAVQCKDKKIYDMELIQKARQQNKPVEQLESMLNQIGFMEKAFSARDVVKHIQLLPENEKLFSEMITLYKNEDLEALGILAQDKRFMTEAAQHWLLNSRNKDWVRKMPAIMKNESAFFAVGAIHLAGENGLVELLKKEGYTVTPVLD
jgi:uncharacterized protein